jgi:hypothetical protein
MPADAEVKSESETEDFSTTDPMIEEESRTIEYSRILLKNSGIPKRIEAHTVEEADLPDCEEESSIADDPLNDLDELLAKEAMVGRSSKIKKSLPPALAKKIPKQNQREELVIDQPEPIRRSRRVVKRKAEKEEPVKQQPGKQSSKKRIMHPLRTSVNEKKLMKTPKNVANIKCRLCQVMLTQKQLWIHNELNHSSKLFNSIVKRSRFTNLKGF